MNRVRTWRLFHAKNGGDIEGEHFWGDCVFFASCANVASTYAEHCFYQDAMGTLGPDEYDNALHAAGTVVYPVLLSMTRPAFLSRRKLLRIGRDAGVADEKLERFADNFEDSDPMERETVFGWLRKNGYDGAILPRDLMPKHAGGDWQLSRSYVSFHPQHQVQFAIGANVSL